MVEVRAAMQLTCQRVVGLLVTKRSDKHWQATENDIELKRTAQSGD